MIQIDFLLAVQNPDSCEDFIEKSCNDKKDLWTVIRVGKYGQQQRVGDLGKETFEKPKKVGDGDVPRKA